MKRITNIIIILIIILVNVMILMNFDLIAKRKPAPQITKNLQITKKEIKKEDVLKLPVITEMDSKGNIVKTADGIVYDKDLPVVFVIDLNHK